MASPLALSIPGISRRSCGLARLIRVLLIGVLHRVRQVKARSAAQRFARSAHRLVGIGPRRKWSMLRSMRSLRVTCARFPAMPVTAEASSAAGTPLWDLGPIRAQVPMERRRPSAASTCETDDSTRSRGRTRPAIALGCTSFTASPERAGCVPSETAVTRITSAAPQRRCSGHPLAGGAGHYLDSAVALAAQLVGIIALGPFRTETAHLDPVS